MALAGFYNAGRSHLPHKVAVPIGYYALCVAANALQFFLHKAAHLRHVGGKVGICLLQGGNGLCIVLQQVEGKPARCAVPVGRGSHAGAGRYALFHGFQYGIKQGPVTYAQGMPLPCGLPGLRAAVVLRGAIQRGLPCGREGLAQTVASRAYRGHGAGAHAFREPQKINAYASGVGLVHHIAGNDHGQAHFAQLCRQQQPALKNARVHHIDDRLHRPAQKHIASHHFFLRIGRERIRTGQVNQNDLLPFVADKALFFFYGHTAVVAHMLVCTRKCVEYCGFAAVGVASNGQPQGIGQTANERAGMAATHHCCCG